MSKLRWVCSDIKIKTVPILITCWHVRINQTAMQHKIIEIEINILIKTESEKCTQLSVYAHFKYINN